MAATFVNASTYASTASVTSLAINAPAGIVPGNLLLLFANNNNASAMSVTATGWTLVQHLSVATDCTGICYYKFATASEPSTYAISNTTSGNVTAACLQYAATQKVAPSAPAPTGTTGSGASLTSPAAPTPAPAGGIHTTDLIVVAYAWGAYNNKGTTTTTPTYPSASGWTSRATAISTGSDYRCGVGVVENFGTTGTYPTSSIAGDSSGAHFVCISLDMPELPRAQFLPFFGM